jgi:hypothetical protein
VTECSHSKTYYDERGERCSLCGIVIKKKRKVYDCTRNPDGTCSAGYDHKHL